MCHIIQQESHISSVMAESVASKLAEILGWICFMSKQSVFIQKEMWKLLPLVKLSWIFHLEISSSVTKGVYFGGRSDIILLDNFSSGISTVRDSSSRLQNTKAVWVTSEFNNLISAAWSRDYLHMKDLLETTMAFYILAELNCGNDLMETMAALSAVRWKIRTLKADIPEENIHNYFKTLNP